ncbi:MAG: hypothetical protein U0798_06605 [Gemmataceae bacterium]
MSKILIDGEMMMAKKKAEGGVEKVNKAQCVRDAIAALGEDAKPQAIQQWILENHKIELNAMMISSYKSNMKKGTSKKGPKKAGSGKGHDILDDITTIKSLITKHGKPNLAKLIDALS